MSKHLSCWSILLLICWLPAFSGPLPPVFYLGIENGLSNNSVTTIFQDHKGFVWLGTYDGLNRYDGYNFKVFRNQPDDSTSLPNNRVAAIAEDQDRRLWIGTRSGVSLYDPVTAAFTPVRYMIPGSTAAKKITALVNQIRISGSNTVFIATDSGLLVYDPIIQKAFPATLDGLSAYQAMATESVNGDETWVYVREKGLYRYLPKSRSLQLVSLQIKNGICEKRTVDGTLYVGADDGLYEYAPQSNTFIKRFPSGNRILQLAEYGSILYIVTDGNGIFQLDPNTHQVTSLFNGNPANYLTSPCIYSMLKDRDGRMWIGTMRGGINILDSKRNKFETIAHDHSVKPNLMQDFVTGIAEDSEGNLWVGTDGNGLNCWDRKRSLYTNFRHSSTIPQSRCNNFITDVMDDGDHCWIASWGGGIDRFDKQTHRFENFRCFNAAASHEDRNAFLLYKDKRQRLWVGTCLEGGLYRYNDQSRQFDLYDARCKNILAMYEDEKGVLWAGDFTSLIRIDETNRSCQRFELGYAVRSILEDRAGNFWVATEGGGLLLFDRASGRYIRYDEKDGLSNNSTLKLLDDTKGHLWISTFNGISAFDIATRKFRNFYQNDGLQSNQFTYNAGLKCRSGQFIFGGIKGMSVFYADSVLNEKPAPLAPLLLGVRINNAPIETDPGYITSRSATDIQQLELPFSKAVLSIDYAALNYLSSGEIRYAYFLEGWDKTWNYVGTTRTANYTRLNEGRYYFHVRAIDAMGNQYESSQILTLVVLPPWYRSWWAYCIYVALAFGLIYIYVRHKSLQAAHKYDLALAKIETEKQKELNEKKLLFFTNIAHEFRTPLTLIIDPVRELLQDEEKRKRGAGLHIVYRNARRLLSLVDQLLLFRKADAESDALNRTTVDFYELCREVFICFTEQARIRGIQYEFLLNEPALELACDRDKMEIVLFNLLSNAIKFTPPAGSVKLQIQTGHANTIRLTVSDTGCGIEPGTGDRLFQRFYQAENNKHKGFGIGLYLSNLFVKAHGGILAYESAPGQGTIFTVDLPRYHDATQPAHPHQHWKPEGQERKLVLIEELMAGLETDARTGTGPAATGSLETDGTPLEKDLSIISNIVSEKKSILLIDDNKDVVNYLAGIFEDRFLVYEADNAQDGIKLARRHLPDMIISDVVMEGLSGVEFCQQVKADPDLSHVPVILLTASASSEVKIKGLECGADDYITKPFEKELLIARVDNILKNRTTLQQFFLDTVTLRRNSLKVAASYRDFLETCIAVLEKEIDNESFSIKSFARAMGMSHSSLYRKVKSVSGLSLNTFIRVLRLRKAALFLLTTDMNISEVAGRVGMTDIKYFRHQFNKLYGMNPSDYVKKYKATFNNSLKVIS